MSCYYECLCGWPVEFIRECDICGEPMCYDCEEWVYPGQYAHFECVEEEDDCQVCQ